MHEAPSSPVYENTKDGERFTLVYGGPYSALVAGAPARNVNVIGINPAFFVDNVRVEKQTGGRGVMTVVMVTNPDPGLNGDPVSEIEWIEVQKKLESHPIFREPGADTLHPNAGLYPLNDADLDAIEEWNNAPTATLRTKAYEAAVDTAAKPALSGNAHHLIDRLKRGQDSYVLYSPHARKTTKNATQPNTSYCGYISDPPAEVRAPGYVYLQTGDRGTRDRNWTRTIEWTGADFIDNELYPVA